MFNLLEVGDIEIVDKQSDFLVCELSVIDELHMTNHEPGVKSVVWCL